MVLFRFEEFVLCNGKLFFGVEEVVVFSGGFRKEVVGMDYLVVFFLLVWLKVRIGGYSFIFR